MSPQLSWPRPGCLDILSSDYIPSSLLLAAMKLGDIWGDLPRGIRTVTQTPAQATNLNDRGSIEIGKTRRSAPPGID